MLTKYQVFVSSTYRDLVEERNAIMRSILDLGQIPAGMESFLAADEEQLSYIKKIIDECDYYIVIIAGRYGSMDANGVGYTEREYDYAVESGKVVLGFIHEDPMQLTAAKNEVDLLLKQKLEAFREKVKKNRLVSFWSTAQELELAAIKSLSKAMQQQPSVGWVRGDLVAREDVLLQINQLRTENDELRQKLNDALAASSPILTDVAGLDENFILSYTGQSSNAGFVNRRVSVKWRDLFLYISHNITAPLNISSINSLVSLFIFHNIERLSNLNPSPGDCNSVRIQFEALGLIRCFTGESTGGGVSAFVQLTPLGTKSMIELGVARTAKNSAEV
ncbi:hypothetical+protein [Methylocapsa aurea]|uniref:DUF4062 domain-containing protein n=1 Tax=Methylocapsa aurea TaxID=663610 RepID=UPI003D18D0BA